MAQPVGKPARPSPASKSRPQPSPGGGALVQLSPREILLCIRERGLTAFILALLLCTLLGAHLLRQPKVYQAHARLLADRSERVLDMAQVVDQNIAGGRNDALFDTYLAQITGPAMVERVITSLTQEEKLRAWRPYAADPSSPPANLDRALYGIVAGNASANRQGNTFFALIRVRHRDPQSAALLATRFAQQFIVHLLDRSTSANNSAIAFLRDQTEELRAKAETSERALQNYREASGMVSLDESRNIVVDRMKTLSGTVTSARVNRLSIEARLRQAEAILADSGDPLELASTAEFANLAAVQSQIDNLNTQRAIMGERYGARHPSMVENLRSREALERLRGELIIIAMANLRNQRAKAFSEEEQLQAELALAEAESLRLDQMSIQFNVLRRDAETNRATYARLLNRLNETTVTAQLESSNIRVADEANVPRVPVEPDTRKIAFMLVALGLGVFVAYPVGLELLFNRIRGWADVESYLNLPLLAELPSLKKVKAAALPRLLSQGDDHEAAEAIRSLYAQLKLGSRLDPPKTLLVTSTLPGEGKSFVASNLADAYASHGFRTLLIDTDFRRPTQHRAYQLPNDAGLLPWLEKRLPAPANPLTDPLLGITPCGPSLHLLRTGGTTRRSTELMESEHLGQLLTSLRSHFDIILIDTPPAGVFPDALALTEHASELLYVIRHNHVPRPAARRVLERIARTGIEQPGIILNLMPSGRGSSSYYSGYGHYGSKYYAAYAKTEKA